MRVVTVSLYGIDHNDNGSLRLASSVARNGLLYKDSFLLNLCHAFVPVAGKDAS